MYIDEKVKFYLAPRQTINNWAKDGLLCRKMKVIDKDNTYIPPNLFKVANNIWKNLNNKIRSRTIFFIINIFFLEDEYGWVEINELKNKQFIKTDKTFNKYLNIIKTVITIEKQTNTHIQFNYSKLVNLCGGYNEQ